MPGEEPGPRYLFERTTHDTASAAAALASAARAWAPYDPPAAAGWLAAAERAWGFLEQHAEAPVGGFKNPLYPPSCPGDTGEYNDEYDADNRLHAAAELYRATGRAEYNDYVRAWFADPVFTNGNSGAGAGKYAQVPRRSSGAVPPHFPDLGSGPGPRSREAGLHCGSEAAFNARGAPGGRAARGGQPWANE